MSITNVSPAYAPLRQIDETPHEFELKSAYSTVKQPPRLRFSTTTDHPRGKEGIPRPEQAERARFGLTWRYEIASCMLLVGAFCAIVATLSPFENKRLPRWKYGLSLNTLVAIYVVILKASMLLVASQCLSHLKWLWFRDDRALLDLETYDEASRGPWGSLKLLWNLRARPVISSLGAVVTVASLFIDPFA